MVAAPPVPPTWFALPPEVNTARLMVGAGPAPMLQAATGWEGLAILLETQADELAGALSNLTAVWSGGASERAVSAAMPMIIWLRTMALQAQKRALQAGAQASSYTLALTTTPPIPEIEQNHITHGVLEATNFLGINTMPIGLNEMDYFVRMWNQAAGAMEAYHAETTVNLLFEPIMPMTPIVLPGIGETTVAAALASTAPRTAMGAARNMTVEGISALSTLSSMKLLAGNAAAQANHAEQRAVGAASKGENAGQQEKQDPTEKNPMQQGMQMAMQMGQQAGQIAGQIPQMLQSPMQAMTQPLQQVTQMVSQFSSMGGSDRGMQVGLMGAMPFSNHPLAGGAGPSSGAGLVRAASLPGALGSPPRTALLSSMLGISGEAKPAAAGVASGAAGPVAPVGAGGGGGPGAPVGAGHNEKKGGGTKDGLIAPTALTYDQSEDADDDW
ncbi:PPE family protein [Mycobacterium sp. 48b]|uniref:PPE family protein n=1 Tax=Mycobacterium sp. 48b TaxID=3400426 RepID=UPI003AAA9021